MSKVQGEKYARWKIHRVKNPGRKFQGRVEKYAVQGTGWKIRRVKNTQGEKSRAEHSRVAWKIRSARTQGEKYTGWKIHRVKNPGRKFQGRVKNTQGDAQGEKYTGWKIRSPKYRVKNTQGEKYTGGNSRVGWKIRSPRHRVKNTQGEKYTGAGLRSCAWEHRRLCEAHQ